MALLSASQPARLAMRQGFHQITVAVEQRHNRAGEIDLGGPPFRIGVIGVSDQATCLSPIVGIAPVP